MKNLWALVQDNEYVFSKLFQEFELFPKVHGTCGGLYAVERLEPLTFPSLFGTNRYISNKIFIFGTNRYVFLTRLV